MKRWAIVTALLYMLILAAFFPGALHMALFFPDLSEATAPEIFLFYESGVFWLVMLLFFLSQLALLAIPVARESGRPVQKRHVASLVVSSSVLFAFLLVGFFLAMSELIGGEEFKFGAPDLIIVKIILLSWCIWALVFIRLRRGRSTVALFDLLMTRLFQGSILELLIVVPCHIYVRSKDYCCAGFNTFWGIAAGVSVMLFAFGPAVFVLFAQQLGHTRKAFNGPDTQEEDVS